MPSAVFLKHTLATTLTRVLQRLITPVRVRKRPYSLFNIALLRRTVLSPSMTRFVFGGPDIALMRTLSPDQRVKLLFAAANGSPSALPCDDKWQTHRRDLPAERQPPMRTYTLRALRTAERELDIDFVLHGETGPASTWATHAQPGQTLQIAAPLASHHRDPGGYEWRPPQGIRHVLLIGDETALPAIAGIIEQYAAQTNAPRVQAFIEVPSTCDCLALACHPSTQINWLPREDLNHSHGQSMLYAVHELADLPLATTHGRSAKPLDEVNIDTDILWESAQSADNSFYAWVAGESAAVMTVRKYLINELGLDRRAMTFMGYWRQGRALN